MLHQILQQISSIALSLVNHYGYWGIFFGMILESACIPLSSEVMMLFGGFLVAQGHLNLWGVVWAGILGNIIGSVLTFWVGAKGGRTFLRKYGKYILLNEQHLAKADQWFSHHGESTVFFTRNLPIIRTFISLPAGISQMNFAKFFIFTALGCIPWNVFLTYLGLKLGQNWKFVEKFSRPISYSVLLLSVAGIIYFLSISRSRRKA